MKYGVYTRMNRRIVSGIIFLMFLAASVHAQNGSGFLSDKNIFVLDVQDHFTTRELTRDASDNLIRNINKILDKANPDRVMYFQTIIRQLNISFKGIHLVPLPDLGYDKRLNFVGNFFIKKYKEDAFSAEATNQLLDKYKGGEIIVMGLMAEGSVTATVLSALGNGYSVVIIPETIEGKSTNSKERVLEKLQKKGAKIIHLSEIINP